MTDSDDDPDWFYNYQKDGAFIRDRTAHRLRELEGTRTVTAVCGFSTMAEEKQLFSLGGVASTPPDRYKCGNCGWDEVDE